MGIKILIVAYIFMAICVFGNAARYFELDGIKEYDKCISKDPNNTTCDWKKSKGLKPCLASIAWPLYISYRISEHYDQ